MNKLNTAGTHVIDAQGKEWALETPHPMPLPDGIGGSRFLAYYNKYHGWTLYPFSGASHWIQRTEPPAPKTQEEIQNEADEEWFTNWWSRNVESMIDASYARQVVHAALAYARKQP